MRSLELKMKADGSDTQASLILYTRDLNSLFCVTLDVLDESQTHGIAVSAHSIIVATSYIAPRL